MTSTFVERVRTGATWVTTFLSPTGLAVCTTMIICDMTTGSKSSRYSVFTRLSYLTHRQSHGNKQFFSAGLQRCGVHCLNARNYPHSCRFDREDRITETVEGETRDRRLPLLFRLCEHAPPTVYLHLMI